VPRHALKTAKIGYRKSEVRKQPTPHYESILHQSYHRGKDSGRIVGLMYWEMKHKSLDSRLWAPITQPQG